MNRNTQIPIFFSCDDKYIPYFSVALSSLIENASKKYSYKIFVLHANSISKENREEIIETYSKCNFKIKFVDITDKVEGLAKRLHTRDYYSKSTYFRLFIPQLFPQYDKAIYLDSDIVVLGDVSKLYAQKLGDNLVGAVTDQAVMEHQEFIDYVVNKIGVKRAEEYFNAGILLMNLQKMREENFENMFVDLLGKVTFSVAQDQDYLNVLCMGRTKFLDRSWNEMPIGRQKRYKKINIIHYNLAFKPWHADNIMYGEKFWQYARQTGYFYEILKEKQGFDEYKQSFANMQTLKLLAQAKEEASAKLENRRIFEIVQLVKNRGVARYKERMEILQKIEIYEKNGWFDKDVENDPPSRTLMPNEVDYLQRKLTTKIKARFANSLARKFINKILKEEKLIIKDIVGIENWQNLKGGAVITCNHFNPFDSFAMQLAFDASLKKNKKMYKVIREGNYTSFSGLYGMFFRNCNTLPLSSNAKTMGKFMGAVQKILADGDYVLVYPEQSMWWNYRKPKPLKNGAYKFAVKGDVPILPCFITMEDSDKIGDDGFPIQEYTIHISPPIYPDMMLEEKKAIEKLKNQNYQLWKKCYEEFYGKKLEYVGTFAENLPQNA